MVSIAEVDRLLTQEYGDRPWQPHHDPVSELVATILSQNTSDINSGRAFAALQEAFGSWENVAATDVAEIERAIRPGGLSVIKAERIKRILQEITEERGRIDLGFLGDLPLDEARAWLRRLPGVGPKTVGCVLLFSLGKPVLPVDTHVYRVSRRLGLIPQKVSVEAAHHLLESAIDGTAAEIYRFHINMVEHGRRVCKSQRPRRSICVLRGVCEWNESDSRN